MAPKLEGYGPCTSNESGGSDGFDKVPSTLYDPVHCRRYLLVNYLGKVNCY